jgi:Ca2+-binding EF-hand superfamily protein
MVLGKAEDRLVFQDYIKYFTEIDVDSDGSVTLDEFIEHLSSVMRGQSSEEDAASILNEQYASARTRSRKMHAAPSPPVMSSVTTMSDLEYAAMNGAFERMDGNCDGFINRQEIYEALLKHPKTAQDLGIADLRGPGRASDKADRVFNDLDVNDDNSISLEEFAVWWERKLIAKRESGSKVASPARRPSPTVAAKRSPTVTQRPRVSYEDEEFYNDVAAVFRSLDTDGNGRVSVLELANGMDDQRSAVSVLMRMSCSMVLGKAEDRLVFQDYIKYFTEIDADSDGSVTLDEFIEHLSSVMRGQSSEQDAASILN